MYKLNVGDKDGGQMEDDDQFLVWEIGRMVSSGNHWDGTGLMGKILILVFSLLRLRHLWSIQVDRLSKQLNAYIPNLVIQQVLAFFIFVKRR